MSGMRRTAGLKSIIIVGLGLLLACSGLVPGAKKPLDPTLLAAMNDPALGLDASQKASIEAYAQTQDEADVRVHRACERVKQAQALRGVLFNHIDNQNPKDEEGLIALEGATAQLGQALPGIQLVFGSEGLKAAVAWSELADDVGPESKSGRVLLAAHGVLGEYSHYELIDWSWDLGGCINLARSTERLSELHDALNGADQCMIEQTQDPLRQAVAILGRHHCYCLGEAEIKEQFKKLSPVLMKLKGLDGPAVHAKMEAAFKGGQAVYNDDVCGG